jgi:aryl-alcohol dehydrogenase-like predicted oxidoreductase
MLTERNLRIADEVGKVAAELGTKSTAVAIAWVLARRGVTSVIIGPRTLDQYEQNMEGFRVELDDDAVHKLNQVSRPEQ